MAGRFATNTLRGAVTDALAGGIVAAALALPMLGFRLVDSALALTLATRFDWVLWAALAVFAGRLALNLLRLGGSLPSIRLPDSVTARLAGARPWVGWAMIAFAAALPFLPFSDRNLVDKATMVLIYVMLGWGLNIVVGLAGLLDLGFVAFYAVGAYFLAIGAAHFEIGFWSALALAPLLAAVCGAVLAFPVLRMHGDYLAIVTLGFGEIFRLFLINAVDFTGGPNGLPAPEITLFGIELGRVSKQGGPLLHELLGIDYQANHRFWLLYAVLFAVVLVVMHAVTRLRVMPMGRAWEALREDEVACRSLGMNHVAVKLSAFMLGALIGGLAGVFFGTQQGFVNPTSFTFLESVLVLSIVVLGGLGSTVGVVLAAIVLTVLPELLRDFAEYRTLVFGALMVVMMLWRPRGLIRPARPAFAASGATRGDAA